MINVQEKKDKIIQFLQGNGPSLPVRISRAIEMDPIIAIAIASELIDSNKVKISNMKIGSSPLYFLPGQEERLVDFTENLKIIERQTIEKLKENKVLSDSEQEPATRVALRGIKDFASPFRYNEKIMWKYSFITDEQARKIMQDSIKKDESKPRSENEDEKLKVKEEELDKELEKTRETQEEKEIFQEETKSNEPEPEVVPKGWVDKREEIKEKKEAEAEKQTRIENIFSKEDKEPEPEFLVKIKQFLKKKNIEFIEEIRTEKKEIMAKVRIDSQLGNFNMLLIAKDKKTTTKDEIRASIQMATRTDMPCLLIIRKEPAKSIQNLLENNSLIKIEVME